MRNPIYFLIVVFIFCNGQERQDQPRNLSEVEIVNITQDSLFNVRSIEISQLAPEGDACLFLSSKGEFGSIFPNAFKPSLEGSDYGVHLIDLSTDSLTPNFRAMATSKTKGFGITIGSPALLYKLDADLEKNEIVYREDHPKAFYDSMEMWNDLEGLAIGDPTDNCMSIIITRDGGETWKKLPCEFLPEAKEGEAAFAASDTNIAIVGDKTWVATGGKASRILYSPDKGKTWEVFETPIVQGKETTGMYSIDFYDALNGFAIGGDYLDPENNSANKIVTKDGGNSWTVVGEGVDPGYRSCVQYVPDRAGNELVAVGFKGIDFSNDAGNSWKHLSDEDFYTIRFLNDSVAYAAGRGRVSKLIFRE